jgi:16S rRNA (adenine1518-N6/adenine1519-N6)-dimethyltransferase
MIPLPSLRQIIEDFQLQAKKSLGQHFLLDPLLLERIVRAAGDLTGKKVVEIGPGPGGLTRALVGSSAAHITAIERDSRCIAALQSLKAQAEGRLTLIEGDGLEIKIGSLSPTPSFLVANLPYNVSVPLLLHWLQELPAIERMLLMFQKEVVDRLKARPGTKDYGRLSIMTQWLCQVEPMFDISPHAFSPAPKVTSTVVRLTPHSLEKAPFPHLPWATLEALTQAAFGQRRKMLRSSLKSLGTLGLTALEASGIPETARAEELSVEDFCRLGSLWDTLRK